MSRVKVLLEKSPGFAYNLVEIWKGTAWLKIISSPCPCGKKPLPGWIMRTTACWVTTACLCLYRKPFMMVKSGFRLCFMPAAIPPLKKLSSIASAS